MFARNCPNSESHTMLSPQLRQRIYSLWTSFWSSGMTNPITSIEQITYLLFLQQLERLDGEKVAQGKLSIYAPDHEQCRWSHIRALPNAHSTLTQIVFPWLRGLGSHIQGKWGNGATSEAGIAEYLADAYFQLPPEKTSTLQHALQAVDALFETAGKNGSNADLMGDIFEYLLSELNTAGKNGQFRTPRHLIRFMIELVDPEPGKRVFDPAGGTGGFLTNTILHHWMKKTPPSQLRLEWDGTPHRLIGREKLESDIIFDGVFVSGFDIDRTMVRIGWMNLILHGIDNPRFIQTDPLSQSFKEPSNSYDYAFANPPYSGTVDRHDLNPTRFPRKGPNSSEPITDRTELLFLWLMLDLLKPGGRMAVIVPEGLLFGSTGAHKALRRELLFQHEVEGVISLPQGVFQPYTGVKTSILVVKKGEARTDAEDPAAEPRTKQVWFYEIQRDGFTLGANRTPQPEQRNDLWDALEKWKRRKETAAEQKPVDYWQPKIHRERWRQIDKQLTNLFPETATQEGDVLAVQ